jgi:predicted signal transduction protein with EAL and GGDEF domain
MLSALRAPLTGMQNGQGIVVTASIGIGLISDRDVDARQPVRRADAAMYAAKGRGGDQYALGETIDSAVLTRRPMIENALRHAIERHELRTSISHCNASPTGT